MVMVVNMSGRLLQDDDFGDELFVHLRCFFRFIYVPNKAKNALNFPAFFLVSTK